jgi:hypothetical protein
MISPIDGSKLSNPDNLIRKPISERTHIKLIPNIVVPGLPVEHLPGPLRYPI